MIMLTALGFSFCTGHQHNKLNFDNENSIVRLFANCIADILLTCNDVLDQFTACVLSRIVLTLSCQSCLQLNVGT